MAAGAPTPEERAARGRAARTASPRSGHASLERAPTRDPLSVLTAQDATRVPELVPLRYGRMLASPFAFFRGAAAVMAQDLAPLPATGLRTQLCGDAHLANFGGFGSPERDLVFDLNDFDETCPGPFEWDLKRLATSIEIAGRTRGFDDPRGHVLAGVAAYREAMSEFAGMRDLDVWYSHLDASMMVDVLQRAHDARLAKQLTRVIDKARRNDGRRALATLTRSVDGHPRIVFEPPLLVPLSELALEAAERVEVAIREIQGGYRRSLAPDRRALLDWFNRIDVARKVVGIGSVGTRCWVVLLAGRDENDPLFLQIKEAEQPVLGSAVAGNQGRRVVEGQRLMQAASDIFLGWGRATAVDGIPRDFYIRQLRDWKASLDLEATGPDGLTYYARACGWTLARAHARGGDRIAIAGYLGTGDRFDRALASFSSAYADLNEQDHKTLERAVAAGEIAATTDE
ncbi:MAG TPA: DUF2252 domain-containing protein [Gaiellaceae bacterium]